MYVILNETKQVCACTDTLAEAVACEKKIRAVTGKIYKIMGLRPLTVDESMEQCALSAKKSIF